jgi:hypothetical protein
MPVFACIYGDFSETSLREHYKRSPPLNASMCYCDLTFVLTLETYRSICKD